MPLVSQYLLNTMHNHTFTYGNHAHQDYHYTNRNSSSHTCKLTALRTTVTVVYSCIILLVVLLNTFILISLRPFKCMRRRCNLEILVMYLAVFDLLASVMLVSQVYQEITCDYDLGSVGCKLVYPTYQIFLSMSVCILIIMSVDRCISLWYPTSHRKLTARKTHVIVGIAFAVSVLIQTYQFLALRQDEKGICRRDRSRLAFGVPRIIITVVRDSAFISVAVMTCVITYRVLHDNKIIDENNSSCSKAEVAKHKARQRLTMINAMQLVFGALVIPYDVFDCFMQIVVMADININYQLIEIPDIVLSVLQMSSSFANCFVFAKKYRCLIQTHPIYASRRTTNADTDNDDENVETSVVVSFADQQDIGSL